MSSYTPIQCTARQYAHCPGWIQEAAKRMLMNNLDPEVAEKPEELIVYGGRGKAARNWECYHTLIDTLDRLKNHETLLVQSGKAVAVLETHPLAPRVLDCKLQPCAALGNMGRVRSAGSRGPDDVRPDDCRLVDLHRDAGNSSGNLRDVSGRCAEVLQRIAERDDHLTAGLGGMGGAQPLGRKAGRWGEHLH